MTERRNWRLLRGYYRINRRYFPLSRRAALLDAWRLFWTRGYDGRAS